MFKIPKRVFEMHLLVEVSKVTTKNVVSNRKIVQEWEVENLLPYKERDNQ